MKRTTPLLDIFSSHAKHLSEFNNSMIEQLLTYIKTLNSRFSASFTVYMQTFYASNFEVTLSHFYFVQSNTCA